MTIPTDVLNEEYTIDTPENVSIGYSVAGIGNRFIAALVDSALLGAALIVIQLLLVVALARLGAEVFLLDDAELGWEQGLVVALYALGSFSLIWGYFILFEWLWQGQTPGKRVSNIRVVRLDGSPPRFLDIAVRNLVRIIDFLPFGYGIGLIVMFFNREARRLGDLAAGVIVVKDRSELRLEDVVGPSVSQPVLQAAAPGTDMSASVVSEPMTESMAEPMHAQGGGDEPSGLARFPAVRRLRVADFELIEESLRRHAAGTLDSVLLVRLAQAMEQKAGGIPTASQPASQAETQAVMSRRLLNDILDTYRAYHVAA